MPKLLLVEHDPLQRKRIELGLRDRIPKLDLVFAGTLDEAGKALKDPDVRCVLGANAFPEREGGAAKSGADLVEHAKRSASNVPVIIHDESISADARRKLLAMGARAVHERRELMSLTMPKLRKYLQPA